MGKGPLELYGLKPSPTNSEEIVTAPIFAGGHMPAGSFLQYDGRISNKADLVNKGYVDNKAQTSEVKLSQLADDIDPELKARMEDYDQSTQEDLNNEIGWSLFNQRRKGTRTTTNLDIIQSTVATVSGRLSSPETLRLSYPWSVTSSFDVESWTQDWLKPKPSDQRWRWSGHRAV